MTRAIKIFFNNIYNYFQFFCIIFYWFLLTLLTFISDFRNMYIDFFFDIYLLTIEIFGNTAVLNKILNFFSIFELFFFFFLFSYIFFVFKFFYVIMLLSIFQWCSMFIIIFDIDHLIPEAIFEKLYLIYIFKYVRLYFRLFWDFLTFKRFFNYFQQFIISLLVDFQIFLNLDLIHSEEEEGDLGHSFIFFFFSIIKFCIFLKTFFLYYLYCFWIFLN